ncbi:MAG: hypothetical protein ACE5HZ_07680 [Fidelibacterota bacterium]
MATTIRFNLLSFLCVLCVLCGSNLLASGAFDHGTATGRGNLELDFTWNPFNLFDQGQSYVVFGYGLTDRLDIHGYYATPVEGGDNYYLGVFYQFFEHGYLDLATAVGIRRYTTSERWHVFVPQLLYNVKLGKGFTVGGSAVTLLEAWRKSRYGGKGGGGNWESLGTTFDVALFVPLTRFVPKGKWVKEVKLGIGAFRPVLWKPKRGSWYPTYSIDVKFHLGKGK